MKQKSSEDDDYFFFGVPKKLGSGTKKDPVHIMMTSIGLMDNLKHLPNGVFQLDGTYLLTKNNYPWIVCGVVDLQG